MSAKILASMKTIDASLTLIASKVVNGEYDSIESLKAILINVGNAVKTSQNALTVAMKPASQGRQGLVAMSTTASDDLFGSISQVNIKASILEQTLESELKEMEENEVEEPSEEIAMEDFSEYEPGEEVDHTSTGMEETPMEETPAEPPMKETPAEPPMKETPIEPAEETPAEEASMDYEEEVPSEASKGPEKKSSSKDHEGNMPEGEYKDASLDDMIEEESFEDPEGTLDSSLAEFTGSSGLDHEQSDYQSSSDAKEALKSTMVASKTGRGTDLSAVWDFMSD